MSRLIIGNQLPEETAEGEHALPEDYARLLGAVAHRFLWVARPEDVLVLPTAPDQRFVEQIRRYTGLSTPTVVVPPVGPRGDALLYDERLDDPGFTARLRDLVADSGADELYPFYLDDCVARLAARVGLAGAVAGNAFLAEGGNEFVNSKHHFRAVAAGNGVSIPSGVTVSEVDDAEEFGWSLLRDGESVIVKQDVNSGGAGNEILVPVAGRTGIGADLVTHIADRPALRDHLRASWHRHTQGGRRRVVVEHYLHRTVPIYVEFLITDSGTTAVGHGEQRMRPTETGSTMGGLIIPPESAASPAFPAFLDQADRLARAARALGYRGHMSIDAIVTESGEILFNEFNGRYSGSTHLHRIGTDVVGENYLDERVLLSRNRCRWPSVGEVLDVLAGQGLAYDPVTRTGALVSGDDGQVLFVAHDLAAARAMEDVFLKATERGED